MQEVVWKNEEVLRFARSLVKHALEKLTVGSSHFTTDIVPNEDRGDGPGIAGSVVTMLQTANIIEPVGIMQDKIFYAHRVKSERPGAKARYLGVYRLKGKHLAEEFLARNETNVAADAKSDAQIADEQKLL